MVGRGKSTGTMIIFLVIPDINFDRIRSRYSAINFTAKVKKSIFTACQAPNDPARFIPCSSLYLHLCGEVMLL